MAFNDGQVRPPSFTAIIGGVIFLAVLVVISTSVVIVPAGERAVVFDNFRGVLPNTRNEGMTFVVPFVQRPTYYDVKTQTYNLGTNDTQGNVGGDNNESSIEARTSDGQTVHVELSVQFHPEAATLPELHKKIGRDYVDKIIVPAIRSEVRAVIGKYTVESVYSENRQEIENKIESNLKTIFERNFIVLQDVLIRNTRFSEEYQKAIEAKQVALQEAERMQYVLQKQRQEKERKIVEAQGEAEAIRIKGQALSANPRLIQYEYVQKIAPGVKAVIADQKTIMNFSNLFESTPAK